MINPTDAELVAEFIGYHCMALDSENILRRQGAEWAPSFLGELVYDDPERCWRVTKAIASGNPSEDAMMYLGVVLSSLLREHPEIIGIIEEDSKTNNELRVLLSWVMEDENIPERVWQKIEAISEGKS